MWNIATAVQHNLEVLARAIRQKKEIKGIQIIKEKLELSLLQDNMLIYIYIIEPKDPIKLVLELVRQFGKLAKYKIN